LVAVLGTASVMAWVWLELLAHRIQQVMWPEQSAKTNERILSFAFFLLKKKSVSTLFYGST
jgi:hypothetical protein